MHRRAFILTSSAALAACAADPAAPSVVGSAAPPPSTPPPPPPPMPPENPAFLARPAPPFRPSGDARFDAWRARLPQIWGEGWRPYLERLLNDLAPVRATPEPVPEGDRTVFYVRQVVTPERIAEGRRRAAEPWLQAIARTRNVPAEILAAVWGAETDFGRQRGEYDLLAWWATRAAVGDFFRDDQIGEAAKLVVEGRIPREALRAFADGSTGQVRWFPLQYEAMAQDGDGDRLADIWLSPADALASVAARLAGGWEAGSGWVVQVQMPTGADPQTQRLLQALQREAQVRPDYFRRVDGRPWSTQDLRGSATLLQPAGPSGPAFLLLLRNFTPLQYLAGDYRGRLPGEGPAQAWAFAIGLLANGIRGDFAAPPL